MNHLDTKTPSPEPRLPIDEHVPEILARLRESSTLVIVAPPGSGKTTRVPPALLSHLRGEILALEPRRLAARLAARRVAEERGEKPGETVGYQVRFEDHSGPRTRLRFMTEGVLTRRLLSDPQLRGVSAVILDEFHERHLEGDLALALLRRLQRTARPDLRLILMSATLDAVALAAALGSCPVIRAEGRLHDLEIAFTPYRGNPLEEQVAGAVRQLLAEGLEGHALVFLPGAAEIRRAARACQGLAAKHDLLMLPLHGDLPAAEQDRAVAPSPKRKLLLSTNVAESSVTIEGVRAVIDSGLARVAADSPWSGLPSLQVARVSKASATQRAGRAGRTGPGRVIRLYSAEDFAQRAERDPPEILRRELSHTLLDLKAMGAHDLLELPWLDLPPGPAVEAAEDLLRKLGALDAQGAITTIGREMARLPLHPRLARLVVDAGRRGAGEDGCRVAALLSAGERLPAEHRHAGPSDLLALLDGDWSPYARQTLQQLRRAVRLKTGQSHPSEDALLQAILTAFPDRVARRLRSHGRELQLASGPARLAESSVVQTDWMVAVDVEERREQGAPLVRLASAIAPDWLVDLFPERVEERREVTWNRVAERVEAVSALVYDGLVIEESRARPEGEQVTRLLAERAWEAGLARFADLDEVQRFQDRVAFAAEHSSIPALVADDLQAALASLCRGCTSFAELKAAAKDGGLLEALARRIATGRDLAQLAPESIRLPRGRQVVVHYERGKPPWIASRLQDFFGMRATPRVAGGKVPVAVHLLAPNQRPVQVTTDLAGFWERLYPQVRRELMRRYPKHSWPEQP